MEPVVNIIQASPASDNRLDLRIAGVDVSVINGIRRVILDGMPTLGFVGFPASASSIDISVNTSALHNELLKQRLECIPIHLEPSNPLGDNTPIDDIEFEINSKSFGAFNTIRNVTTNDITGKNVKTGDPISKEILEKCFPANPITKEHILILKLRPSVPGQSPSIPEMIQLKMKPVLVKVGDSGCYSLTSVCAYSETRDTAASARALEEKLSSLDKDANREIVIQDWELDNSFNYTIPNSYDFHVQTIGYLSPKQIITRAIELIINKLEDIRTRGQSNSELQVQKIRDTSISNVFEVIITGDAYTYGPLLRHQLYKDYCEPSGNNSGILSLVAFRKHHPHDSTGALRIAFTNEASAAQAAKITANAVESIVETYTKLKSELTQV